MNDREKLITIIAQADDELLGAIKELLIAAVDK